MQKDGHLRAAIDKNKPEVLYVVVGSYYISGLPKSCCYRIARMDVCH